MQKLNKILPIILLFSFISISLSKEMSKDEMYNNLSKKYSNLETVHLLFSIDNNSKLYGELYAKKGGKMQLSLKDNIIISDGNSIWNINPGSSVSISDYEMTSDFSLETIFFNLIKELEPYSLTSINKSNSSDKYNLKLVPKGQSSYKEKIKSLNLYFDSSQKMTKVFVQSQDGSSLNYVIELLEVNPNISNEKFTYKPDGNLEVIDFR